MTRALTIQSCIAFAALAVGAALLFRPGAIGRLLRIDGAPAAPYAFRIAGMMLAALGLFLGGFAAIFAFNR